MRVRTIGAVVAVLALMVAAGATAQTQESGRGFHLKGRLGERTPGEPGPGGKSHWAGTRDEGRGLSVGVGGLDLPVGTAMSVTACGTAVGTIELREGRRGDHAAGRLRLSARRGDAVPHCKPGDTVVVTGGGLTMEGALHPGRGRN